MKKIMTFILCAFILSNAYADKNNNNNDKQTTKALTISQMFSQSRMYLDKMKKMHSVILGIIEKARKDKDIVRLNCANEKLVNANGNLKIAEEAFLLLKEAMANEDKEAASRQFDKIKVAYQTIEMIKIEAQACVGESSMYTGETEVSVEVDKSTVGENEAPEVTIGTTLVGTRPPVASRFSTQ